MRHQECKQEPSTQKEHETAVLAHQTLLACMFYPVFILPVCFSFQKRGSPRKALPAWGSRPLLELPSAYKQSPNAGDRKKQVIIKCLLACFFSLEWDLARLIHVFVTRMYRVKTACQCRGLPCKGRSCTGITSMPKSLHWFPDCFHCQVRPSALIYKATARAGHIVTSDFSFTC